LTSSSGGNPFLFLTNNESTTIFDSKNGIAYHDMDLSFFKEQEIEFQK